MSIHQSELHRQPTQSRFRSTWSDAMMKQASKLWASGVTVSGMAEKLGVSRGAVVGMVHRNQGMFPPRKPKAANLNDDVKDIMEDAARMWMAGVPSSKIAKSFKVSRNVIENMIARNRHLFPKRFEVAKPAVRPVSVAIHPDRVTRVVCGAKVTLPRVTFIDGPYREAAE